MPHYYTQNFSWGATGTTTCFGRQDAHNHERSNKFTKDIKDWLATNANWTPVDSIRCSAFQSHQTTQPTAAKEFRWNDAQKKWLKI